MKKILLIIAIIFCIFQIVVLAITIDMGSPAINRGSTTTDARRTYIAEENPADAAGIIDTIEIWANVNLVDCEVATFYESGGKWYTRGYETIGSVTAGSKQTFSELSIAVEIGDWIGITYSSGRVEMDTSGVGYWYSTSDSIPCTGHIFSHTSNRTISLYGTGISVPDQVTNVQATDGVHTDKVTITWDAAGEADKYYVWNGSSWIDVGDVLTWDHTGAPAPTITHGSVTASDGTSTAHVALSNTGASANNGSSISYKVKAWNAIGYGAESASNSGYRGVGSLTYQWYRSAGDSDASYSSISGATSSTHNDTAAPAGSVPGVPTGLTASDGTYTDKVALTWANVSGGSGAGRYYKCYHTATGATSGYTGTNRGYRKAYTSTNTQVKRDTTELGAIGSLATSYNDTGAAAPTITPGTASASDGTSEDHVTCEVSGESANVGTTHDYYVRTYNAAGWGNYCATNTGYRGVGTLTYQWQRSAGDSDANYSNIDGATTDPYNDTGAPANGDGRYYKCVENATGAEQQITNSDRGYRAVIGWPHKWNTKTISKWNTKEFTKWNGLE